VSEERGRAGKDSAREIPVDLLLEAFRQGKPGAFDAIVRAHQDRVFSFCARMLSDREEALDVSQDVFLAAYRNLDSFRGDASLSTWLLRIAANRCLNRIRQRKSMAGREVAWPEGGADAELPVFQPAAPAGEEPDRVAEAREMGEILSDALGRLDPATRWMVLLSDVEGFAYEEIAALANVPLGTVKSRLHRARMALRQLLATVV
jgi:RNA polymerase sigma-70 factor, ECF subfamily